MLVPVHTLPCEQMDCFQLWRVNKADDDFLHPGRFVFRQALANHRGSANERRTPDTVVIPAEFVTMVLENCELVFDSRYISAHVASVPVLCDQPEGDLFPTPSNQQGDMRVLYSFGWVNGSSDLIVS